MEGLKYCDVKIPKSGNKLEMVSGRIVFVRSVKKLNYYYDVTTGVQLCVAHPDKHDYVLNMIARRIDEVRDFESSKQRNDIQ